MSFAFLSQSFRRLLNSRSFCLPVVLTLSVGIGATVSVFSVIYAVLIKPLPYQRPEQLFSLFSSKVPTSESQLDGFSPADFLDFRERNRTFTDLAASCGFNYNLTGNGEPKHLDGAAISANLFSVIDVQPVLGRTFFAREDRYSSPHVVILSYKLWSEEFHADATIVGQFISLNGDQFLIVGVMPKNFQTPDGVERDLWVPLQQQIRPDRMLWRDQRFLHVFGRLRPGVRLEQARADLNRIAGQLRSEYPKEDNRFGAVMIPLQEALVGDTRISLLLSLGIAVLVLFIATGNVAILMLARVGSRMRELAIRRALGAKALDLLSNVLVESVILGFVSGIIGLVLSNVFGRIFLHFAPSYDVFALIRINRAVLVFALVISATAGFGFGLIPAITVVKSDIERLLRSSGNTTSKGRKDRFFRQALIVGEIALSVVLLMGTALLLRSMLSLQHQSLGFRSHNVITSWVGLPRIRYQNNSDVESFFTRVDQNLRNASEFKAVGLGYPLPLQGDRFRTNFSVQGKQTKPEEYESASLRFIDSGFLPLLDIPVLAGRNFTDGDDATAEAVALVSESFARKYWINESAIGKYISIMRDKPVPRRIVGIVADVRATIEDPPVPTMYVSFKQMSFPSMQIVVLPRDMSTAVLPKIQQAVQRVDPNQPVETVESMDAIMHDSLDAWRFALMLLGGLAGLAVLLTVIGLVAVLSYSVRERNKELGIRMAIGASRDQIVQIVMSQSLRLAVIGIVAGVMLCWVILNISRTMVYAIRPKDPLAFVLVIAFVAMTSIGAAYLPARRASGIDPSTAIHEE